MKTHITILLLFFSFKGFGQLSYEYKKFSRNQDFYICSVPYSNQEYDTLGQTQVFDSRDKLIWKVNRYFAGETVFLSDNGQKLVFIEPFSDRNNSPLRVYSQNGILKAYRTEELVGISEGSCKYNWVYNTFYLGKPNYDSVVNILIFDEYLPNKVEKRIESDYIFLRGGELNIVTCENVLLVINLGVGKITNKINDAYTYFTKTKVINEKVKFEKYPTKFELQYGIPELRSGEPFEIALAKYLDMKSYIPDGSPNRNGGFGFEVKLLIDKKGKAEILKIDLESESNKNRIIDFIVSADFTTKYIPTNIHKAYFNDKIFLMKK
ncbi:hypothetical protein [Anditalea andensis]|uniref:Uncharacterized protein n=1 Tax=Anditalea andensis TaxID=1048983 RepID=A0A074KU56_9BACT|nr:hypothetical protein [Anditalea andensis]KEO71800.1 hypothetical protein EL17_21705 [Anditalea andensis]